MIQSKYENHFRRLWPLHWLLWVCAAVGVAALLIARGHYTVEISWFEDFSSNILRSTWWLPILSQLVFGFYTTQSSTTDNSIRGPPPTSWQGYGGGGWQFGLKRMFEVQFLQVLVNIMSIREVLKVTRVVTFYGCLIDIYLVASVYFCLK